MALQPTSSSSSNKTEIIVRETVFWIRDNQEQFWGVVGVFVLAIAMGAFVYRHHVQQTDLAWNALGPVQSQILQGQSDTAKKNMADWMSHYAGTPAASYAKFLQADLLYKTSDYVNAAAAYGDLAQTGNPAIVRPLALSGQAAAEEMSGHLPQALAITQQFLDRYPDHFMAGSMMLSQARLDELTGNKAAASALYDRFSILYPQTPSVAFAKARIQAITGVAPTAAPTAPAVSLPK